jgi:hypothetical protein
VTECVREARDSAVAVRDAAARVAPLRDGSSDGGGADAGGGAVPL